MQEQKTYHFPIGDGLSHLLDVQLLKMRQEVKRLEELNLAHLWVAGDGPIGDTNETWRLVRIGEGPSAIRHDRVNAIDVQMALRRLMEERLPEGTDLVHGLMLVDKKGCELTVLLPESETDDEVGG